MRYAAVYKSRITCNCATWVQMTQRSAMVNKQRKMSCDWLCNPAGSAASVWRAENITCWFGLCFYGFGQVVFFPRNDNMLKASRGTTTTILLLKDGSSFKRFQVNIFLTSRMDKLAKRSFCLCRSPKQGFFFFFNHLLRSEKHFKWPPVTSRKPVVVHLLKTWTKGRERGLADGMSGWSSWSTAPTWCWHQTSGHKWIETWG